MTILVKTIRPNKSYKSVINQIMSEGSKVAPRGKPTFEVLPAVHEVLRPAEKLCSVPGRRANPFFNMAENMWILAGKGQAEWVCSFNNKLKEFQLDDGETDFNAPYGRRIRFANRYHKPNAKINRYNSPDVRGLPQVDQLLHCYESFRKDRDTRQAVVTLWNPIFDYHENNTKDRPCNTTIYFKIRDNKLHMTVSNRSNDLHLGLYGVNFVQFAHIQEFMAAALDCQIGQYVHLSDSLHIYEDSEHTKNILISDYEFDVYDHCVPYILTHQEVFNTMKILRPEDPSVKTGTNLGDFLIIADQVISESMLFRENIESSYRHIFKYCETNYARACAEYLFTYDYFKRREYNKAIGMIESVIGRGFKDWAVCGMEFMMRNTAFSENKVDIENIVYENFERGNAASIIKYLHTH